MSLHPHLHCIVPGGGVSKSGKWKPAKNKGKYLFNVKSMSRVFRAKYVDLLRKSEIPVPQEIYDILFAKNWVIYVNPVRNTLSQIDRHNYNLFLTGQEQQFNAPKYVVEYLGRYIHPVTNRRRNF